MKYLTLITVACFIDCVTAAPKKRLCLKYSLSLPSTSHESDNSGQDYDYVEQNVGIQMENEEKCLFNSEYCFALWKIEPNKTAVVMKSGCWTLSEGEGPCQQDHCVSSSTRAPNMYFCCCSTDFCNRNMTVNEPAEETKNVILPENKKYESTNKQSFWLSPVVLIFSSMGLIVIGAVLLLFTYTKTNKSESEASPLAPSGPGYSSNLQNVDNLKVLSMIGQGKYGTVWKGMINEQTVAVKIFPTQHKQYFINERNIYSLPMMDNPSILAYFGCDERRTLDDNIEYFLVLSLAPLGCLQDWLMENLASYDIFFKMAKSVTHGLSHLHTEIKKNDKIKPCICHRDLNSRNILVKSDLTCCISDFGFTLKVFGSKYEYKGEVTSAEIKSVNEVGTIRYMAPEILEGAVNLRDCETALKQIDVYSLGLVLWELCTRCLDLYPPGQLVPAYRAPYEAEVGKNPTFEQMQVLVSRHKARPLFPAGWGGGPAAKLARDTCEDCWDNDAEARLTALCAEERIQELSNLRPKSHISRGPSPPLNTNNLTSKALTGNKVASCNFYNPIEASIVTPPNQMFPNSKNALSPMIVRISSPITEKNHIVYTQQIQPYQGRNPCQERNLAPVHRQNQILIEKSKKHSFVDNKGEENSLFCLEDDVSMEELISNTRGNIEQYILGEGFPKQNNTDRKLRGWYGIRALIQKKLFRRDLFKFEFNYDEKSNLVDNKMTKRIDSTSPTKDIRINSVENKYKYQNGSVQTKIEAPINHRPSNLDLKPITVRVNGLSEEGSNKSGFLQNYKNLPLNSTKLSYNEAIVDDFRNELDGFKSPPRIVISRSANAVKNLNKSNFVEDKQIKRQRSLEVFKEVFGSKGSTDRLRDPSQRVKTPGDVPPSVRKIRASKTLSLYDDRMMDSSILSPI